MHLAVFSMDGQSQLPEDQYVNTWHFEYTGALPVTDYENVRDMLQDFYFTTPTGETEQIIDYMPASALGNQYHIDIYDLDDEQPRAPVYSFSATLSGAAGGPWLPTEVAMCMSFQAEKVSGLPQARRRNRIYLGPLHEDALSSGRPSGIFRNVVAAAARDLLQASDAAISWKWRVFSGTLNEGYPVVDGWIDDAFDTQRRRGEKPTQRTLWDDATPA